MAAKPRGRREGPSTPRWPGHQHQITAGVGSGGDPHDFRALREQIRAQLRSGATGRSAQAQGPGHFRADASRLVTRERRAVSIAFLAFGAVMGSWVPRLPALKDHLHISDGQVGYALLAVSLGAVIGAGVARVVLGRGARAWVRGGTIAICASLVLPALAGSFTQLLVSLLVLGVCAGFIDMLENAQAADLERTAGRPLLNGFHGYWSLGAFAGAILAGAAAFAGVPPWLHFALAALVAACASAF